MEYTANYRKISSLRIFNNINELSAAFFEKLVDSMRESFSRNEIFSIALSGGSTPLKIYQYMSVVKNDFTRWDKVQFYWGDERCVPPEDQESNFGNAWNAILKKINIPEDNIHRIRGEDDPEIESERYTTELAKLRISKGVPVFDLIILGTGEDGHTASIFPDQNNLMSTDKWVRPAIHPQSGQKRITLTGKVLNNAREVLFLATGKNKQEVLHNIFNDKLEAAIYPAYHVRPVEGKLSWFVDRDAAERI
jgi:6-phosphogluconolactonase